MQQLVTHVEKELRCVESTAAAARQQLSERDAEAKRFANDSADLKQQLELV